MTAALPRQIEGFHPHARLAYVLDVHAPKLDELKQHIEQIKRDGIVAAWVKVAEGEAPRTAKGRDLAERTYEGARKICELLDANGLGWGGYTYYTDGRDGRREHWDADDEAEHTVSTYARLREHMLREHSSTPSLILMGDAEDGKTDMEAAQRAAWLLWNLTAMREECGHGVGLYVGAHWARKCLLKQGDPIARHYLETIAPLWQPHYGNVNRIKSTAELSAGPGDITPGWRYRAAWQFTSKYLGEFDLNVVDLNMVELPRVCA
jgi:hypothetical protein